MECASPSPARYVLVFKAVYEAVNDNFRVERIYPHRFKNLRKWIEEYAYNMYSQKKTENDRGDTVAEVFRVDMARLFADYERRQRSERAKAAWARRKGTLQ